MLGRSSALQDATPALLSNGMGTITIAPPEERASTPAPPPQPVSPWIYRPWLDLTVGCGAWSAPLLALALFMPATHSHAWAMAFYLLAVVFNYPHFMATIYRAYHTRENFDKYKFVTLHVTLLILATGILIHAF